VTNAPTGTGILLATGCTGRIGRIEVQTAKEDGVKVHSGAHDLVIESGSIRCDGRVNGADGQPLHQDGVQAQGGLRVTFVDLYIDCRTANNAGLFVSGPQQTTQDVVCDGCTVLPAVSTVNLKAGLRGGVRNSIVCQGQVSPAVRIQERMIDPIDENNTVLPRSAAICQGRQAPTPIPVPIPEPVPPPPPAPGPAPVCDAGCVVAYEAQIASLEAQLDASSSEIGRLGSIIDTAANALAEK
jgi:hypothetical protein